jgi:hypothetical protein
MAAWNQVSPGNSSGYAKEHKVWLDSGSTRAFSRVSLKLIKYGWSQAPYQGFLQGKLRTINCELLIQEEFESVVYCLKADFCLQFAFDQEFSQGSTCHYFKGQGREAFASNIFLSSNCFKLSFVKLFPVKKHYSLLKSKPRSSSKYRKIVSK